MLHQNVEELRRVEETLAKLLPRLDKTVTRVHNDSEVSQDFSEKVFNDFKLEALAAYQTTKKSIIETSNKYGPNSSSKNSPTITTKEIIAIANTLPQGCDTSWIDFHRDESKFSIPPKKLKSIRSLVEIAVAQHKVFQVYGNYVSIRRALLKRGWLERIEDPLITFYETDDNTIYENLPIRGLVESMATYIRRCEKKIIAILLKDVVPDLIWNYQLNQREIVLLPRTTLINRLIYSKFSTKGGLCSILQNAHWFMQPFIADVRFPRCFNVSYADQLDDFLENYRISASLSLLKTFLLRYETGGMSGVTSPEGTINISIMVFAMKICHYYISERKNDDIDFPEFRFEDVQFRNFLRNCFKFVHKNEMFSMNTETIVELLKKAASSILKETQCYWPQYDIDGNCNLWIVKPTARCRGFGITLKNNFEEIMELLDDPTKKTQYVCQKYIETPLLIYDHKFDIRQWFLVTSIHPLTIWLYKNCYLRFSSKQFDLHDHHESVHLTNNAIQCKYSNLPKNASLPPDNMWELRQFKQYLHSIKKMDYWDTHIYPQIKEIIIGALLSSQEYIDSRSNCFQMFGADIMVDCNFGVWLLEINSCPQMTGTSAVTTRLCPECFEDIVKVLIDRKENTNADTGNFELIYKPVSCKLPENTENLQIVGKKMKLYKYYGPMQQFNYKTPIIKSVSNLIDMQMTFVANEQMAEVGRCFMNFDSINKHLDFLNEVIQNEADNKTETEDSNAINEQLKEIVEHYESVEKSLVKRIIPIHVGKAFTKIPERQINGKRVKKSWKEKAKYFRILKAVETKETASMVNDILKNYTQTFKGETVLIKEKMYKNFPVKKVRTLYTNKSITNRTPSKFLLNSTPEATLTKSTFASDDDPNNDEKVKHLIGNYIKQLFNDPNCYSEDLKQELLYKCYSESGCATALKFLAECNKHMPPLKKKSNAHHNRKISASVSTKCTSKNR